MATPSINNQTPTAVTDPSVLSGQSFDDFNATLAQVSQTSTPGNVPAPSNQPEPLPKQDQDQLGNLILQTLEPDQKVLVS